MNKYTVLNIIFLVNLFSFVDIFGVTVQDVKTRAEEIPYQKSNQARVLAFIFIKDKERAGRYIKNSEFYAKKSKKLLEFDNALDLIGYPIVDIVIGNGMNKLNEFEPVHNAMENISPSSRKLLLNNAQLITSATIIKFISIQADKGLSNTNNNDVKQFGKSCAAQVGCDVADEYVVKPVVKMLVEDENSWTATGLRFAGNYVLAQYVISKVANS